MKKYLVSKNDGGQIVILAESVAQAAFRAVDYVDAPAEIVKTELYTGSEPAINEAPKGWASV